MKNINCIKMMLNLIYNYKERIINQMKNLKRIISGLIAFIMVLGVVNFSVFAEGTDGTDETDISTVSGSEGDGDGSSDGTFTITVNDEQYGHKYVVYQIFSGTYSNSNDNKILSDVQWGSGVTVAEASTLDASTAVEYIANNFESENDTASWADELIEYLEENHITLNTVDGGTQLSYDDESRNYSADGFASGYYLIRDEAANQPDENYEYTSYLVKVLGAETAVNVKKSSVEVTKKVIDVNDSDGTETNWQDSADYDIGDEVPFQLRGTLPSNYADYDEYYYAFHDEQSDGLTFNKDSVVVEVVNNEGTDSEVTYTVDKAYYTVSTSTSDRCTFEVIINDLNSLYDVDGEEIKVTSGSVIYVYYKSTLNENANIGYTGNNNEVYLEYSNNPYIDGDGSTSKAPHDKVTVFTFKLVIEKVDGEGEALAGATFTLEKYDEDANTDDEDEKWVEVEKVITVSDYGATFTFKGLDDGIYRIVETKAPDGYNKASDVYFKIEATHDEDSPDPTLTALKVYVRDNEGNWNEATDSVFTINKENGSFTTSVVNYAGAELPETGGIGTKMFYTIGGILVVGAGVLLVTRRRMRNA